MGRAVRPDRAGPRSGLAGRRLAGDSTVYPPVASQDTLRVRLDVGADPALVRRLAAGDAATAFDLASRRLRAAGVCCTVRTSAAPVDTARLWAAALAFPITQRTAGRLLQRLDPNKE